MNGNVEKSSQSAVK